MADSDLLTPVAPEEKWHPYFKQLITAASLAPARDMIRDPERTLELHEYIRESREQYGMQTFDQHLMDLVTGGVVTYETALASSSNPADFELQLRTLRRRSMVTGAPAPAAAEADVEPAPERPDGFSDDLTDLLPGP